MIPSVSPTYENAVELADQLKKQGLDVESILGEYELFLEEAIRRSEAVVPELNGQMVRMAGYALPLEHSEKGVKEFLLVPFIGACIHVPPPPPNQIVFVHLHKDFAAKDLYTPVLVTGRMSVTPAKARLTLIDGQSDVAMGYAMSAAAVELRKE
jgi:hypothetical protein